METILLMGHELSGLEVGRKNLQRLGYNALIAADRQEAERLYRQHADNISLVILDLIMPQMGGREMLGYLKRLGGGVNVLVVTGYCPPHMAKALLAEGAAAIVQKPYGVHELAGVVRRVLDYADRVAVGSRSQLA